MFLSHELYHDDLVILCSLHQSLYFFNTATLTAEKKIKKCKKELLRYKGQKIVATKLDYIFENSLLLITVHCVEAVNIIFFSGSVSN